MHIKAARGYVFVQMLGMIILSLMLSAIAIDFGFYYANQNHLQSAADAGSLAAAKELFTSTATTAAGKQASAKTQATSLVATFATAQNPVGIVAAQDVTLGFVDPANPTYNAATFATPNTGAAYAFSGGYNAARVTVRKTTGSPGGQVPTIMSRMLNINFMSTQAGAVAMVDRGIQQVMGGLRPFYACKAQFDLANADNNLSNNTARIFGPTLSLDGQPVMGCPTHPSGNWGFADFRNGQPNAPGLNDLTRWIEQGYNGGTYPGEGPVIAGQDYSSQTGTAITTKEIEGILADFVKNQTVILVPLIDSVSGTGSNVKVHVVGFAGFVITGVETSKGPSQRYVQGYFVNTACSTNCVTGGTQGGGLIKIRLVG